MRLGATRFVDGDICARNYYVVSTKMIRIEFNCNRATAIEGSLEEFTGAKRVVGLPAVLVAKVSITRCEAATGYCLANNLVKFETVCNIS